MRHYNTDKQQHDVGHGSQRLGALLTLTPKVGINLDVHIGPHIWAFWWHPRGYGPRNKK